MVHEILHHLVILAASVFSWTAAIWHEVLTVVGLFQFILNLIRGKDP